MTTRSNYPGGEINFMTMHLRCRECSFVWCTLSHCLFPNAMDNQPEKVHESIRKPVMQRSWIGYWLSVYVVCYLQADIPVILHSSTLGWSVAVGLYKLMTLPIFQKPWTTSCHNTSCIGMLPICMLPI